MNIMRKRIIAMTLMVAFLLSAEATSIAQALGGPKGGSYRLAARDKHVWKAMFVGGRSARVAVVGDGLTILDLYIYDLNGNLVARDERSTVTLLVEWYPRYTETFYIEVVNRGNVYNDYSFSTN